MIHRVRLRRFKRFGDVEFVLPGHIVLAGPNNMGKTTVLQAIAAWSLALDRWKQLNDFHRHGGFYTKAPIARQAFSAVPLRSFNLLWREREYDGSVEIEIQHTAGWTVAMELIADSTEQIYVRPRTTAAPDVVRQAALTAVFVPAMSGLGTEEPLYQRPKVDQLLGQAKPGDVLRNLLVEASGSQTAWASLQDSIQRLFGFELVPPDAAGAHILAEYRERRDGRRLDVASAGSGFQQLLMLLTFLQTRPGSVLLLDEPDAHLHVILQDAIYSELRAAAARQQPQLVIATHAEVIVNAVEPRELCVILDQPHMLATTDEQARLIDSLRILSHTDVMLARGAPGVLYLEDYTDLDILRAWARVLDHPARELLTTRLFWKRTVVETRPGAPGVQAREHYEALRLVRADLPAVELIDGDARPEIQATPITGEGFQRLRWRRYEIESYLLHPDALARFVTQIVGAAAAPPHLADLRRYLEENFPPAVLREPLGDHAFLNATKVRTQLLPPALAAAGLPALPYTRYPEIAAVMTSQEIHPEVVEKLDGIMRSFGLCVASTVEVDFWTSRDVREVVHSHLNYVVADTARWEQSAAYVLDTHPLVEAFVKNASLGFAIPYLHNGQAHDYVPDFIVRLSSQPPLHLILETKGYDPLEEVKTAAARRWVAAVNAEGSCGRWRYGIAKRIVDVAAIVTDAVRV